MALQIKTTSWNRNTKVNATNTNLLYYVQIHKDESIDSETEEKRVGIIKKNTSLWIILPAYYEVWSQWTNWRAFLHPGIACRHLRKHVQTPTKSKIHMWWKEYEPGVLQHLEKTFGVRCQWTAWMFVQKLRINKAADFLTRKLFAFISSIYYL